MSTQQMARWRLILGAETENSFTSMGGAGFGGGQPQGGPDDVVDADYEVLDDDK